MEGWKVAGFPPATDNPSNDNRSKTYRRKKTRLRLIDRLKLDSSLIIVKNSEQLTTHS